MSNIGFVSYWGWGRGRAMVTLCYAKMLREKHNVFILQEMENPLMEEEFNLPDVEVRKTPHFDPNPEVFKKWVEENDLDAVVFNEYGQWGKHDNHLPELAKDMGLRTYGFLVYEKFKPQQTERFDRIFVPSVTGERFMRKHKVRHFTYAPYSLDLSMYDHKGREDDDSLFTFIHPGGLGGVHERKNTKLVIDAFEELDDENTRLVITSQKPLEDISLPERVDIVEGNITHEELIQRILEADSTVLPSKWETIGIPILESLAVGTPVITPDVPPMNEFVKRGTNGMLCKTKSMTKYEDISILAAEISVTELKKQMANMVNLKFKSPEFYQALRNSSRAVVEELYDLDKNKKYLLEFIEKDLGEQQ